ncbi:MAG TPA: replicative DNA helicase [Jiangellaceae bacterium]
MWHRVEHAFERGEPAVTVTELPDRHGERPSSSGYDRTPPQDVTAEQSVLGGMLLSKDAIADVVEVLHGHDMYRPAHETIYEAILELYGRGEPADPVTVAAELQKQGDLARVGGAPYLHTLVSSVPTAANAGYYAQIVRERAVLRRLVEAGTRIVQMGYGGDGEVDDIVDRAQAEVYGVTDRRTSEDYLPLQEIMEGTLDEIEAIGSRGGEMVGVPTGFADLDALTNGLHPGQMIVVAARPAIGKALALDTPLPTPTGWTIMGEVRVGDELFGADGKPTRVVAATGVMLNRPCYEVQFSDGSVIVADAQHQWATPSKIVKTEDMAAAVAHLRPSRRPDGAIRLAKTTQSVLDVRKIDPVPVRCVEVDSSDHLYLAGPARIPTHNSTLGLDLARAAAIRHQLTTVMFSLEMSRNEITMRLLSAEARVPLHHMRTGSMTDDDWNRVARRSGELHGAPLFLDDSPNMTMMEIRAKCRRLKQRHDLRLVIVDYLQLMSSGKRVESRQQEVAEFSRALKLLAKEIDVPVVAISQLNRSAEQRQDKKPMLADLRESGCMPASTRLLRADNGQEITLGELLLTQIQPDVLAVDNRFRLVPSRLTKTFPSGIKPVFRLRLMSGRMVDATANHRFLTVNGWVRLDELAVGSAIAVPRRLPAAATATTDWDDDHLVLLAHLLGDGSIGPNSVKYATADLANKLAVEDAAKRAFGITVKGEMVGRTWQMWLPSPVRLTHNRFHPVREWLEPLGLWGSRSGNKFIPEPIFGLADDKLALFLRHLWATDGSITFARNGRGPVVRIYYASTSRRLAENVQRALLRFEVRSRVMPTTKYGYGQCWNVIIQGAEDQIRFLKSVGCHGERGARIPEAVAILAAQKPNTNVDLIPWAIVDRVKRAIAGAGLSHRQVADRLGERYGGSYMLGSNNRQRRFSRGRLARIAQITNDSSLLDLATSHIYWDAIAAIEPLGDMPVFDATVEGTHNFIANGIVAHNSIEQDSDMVILLHREDAYEKESPRAGEADFIVAKHRNGPTATITVAFQGHYSRFVDMAQ